MSAPRFAEVFAGAGALGMAFEAAGWANAWHAEIDEAPRSVLRHHWPNVPLYGDVKELDGRALVEAHGPIAAIIGGSPCQDLSQAGNRKGLDGERSSLFYEQMRLWDETGADLCLWENVDGARSNNDGRDFAEVLGSFVGSAVAVPSRGWRSAGVVAGPTGVAAWRVFDAQFFGVPQRRRRVFVFGTRAGTVDPAEVLSLAEGVPRHPRPRRAPRKGVTAGARGGVAGASEVIAFHHQQDPIFGDVCPALSRKADGMGVLAFNVEQITHPENRSRCRVGDPAPTLCERGLVHVARLVEFGGYAMDDVSSSINRRDFKSATDIVLGNVPRRLTPRECERLMGWPDDHTLVRDSAGKFLRDGARYRMCGNGVARPVAQWIGWRARLALDGRELPR